MRRHWVGLLLVWAASACGGNQVNQASCPAGSERCACYGNGTCDGVLECRSELCVAPTGGGGGAGTGGGGGAGGGGGTSGGGAMAGGSGPGGSTARGGADASADGPTVLWAYHNDGTRFEFKDPSLAAGVRDDFAGPAATTGAPSIVYPLDGAMLPPNLGTLSVQWTQGDPKSDEFAVELSGGGQTFVFYLPCSTAQCTYQMPAGEWTDLGAHMAGQTVTARVRGTAGAGASVATSAERKLSFSPDVLHGGLYYWASSIGAIKRASFGATRANVFIETGDDTIGLGQTPCVGCHSVSRDGRRIAFSVTSTTNGSGSDQPWGVFVSPTDDLAHPLVAPPMAAGVVKGSFGANVALNADGSWAAVNGVESGETLFLDVRRTTSPSDRTDSHKTGDAVFKPYDMAIMPEWSPDGVTLAAALVRVDWSALGCYWDHLTCNATIGLFAWDGAHLGNAVALVANAPGHEKDMHFYPTWSPDGKWIAFVSQQRHYDVGDAGSASNNWGYQSSYDAKNGVLRMVPSGLADAPYLCPGPQCVELLHATQYGWAEATTQSGKGSTLPKFAPYAQGPSQGLMFLTFTSRIDYGFTTGDLRQLWMSAIDVTNVGAGVDPSYAPFWIPAQSLTEKNVEAYWTETLYCTSDATGTCRGCLAGERCVQVSGAGCACETQ